MIYKWFSNFKRGITKQTYKIYRIVSNGREVKVNETDEILKISTEWVRNTLREHLHMKKLCSQ